MMINKFLVVIFLSILALVNTDAVEDLVPKLDGYLDYSSLFKMYSGYL